MAPRIDWDRIGIPAMDVEPFILDMAFPAGGEVHDS
jgi:hypothetical protein